jgi:hypothetical protein
MWGLAYGTDYTSGTNGIWEQNGTAAFSTSNQQNIVGTLSNYIVHHRCTIRSWYNCK